MTFLLLVAFVAIVETEPGGLGVWGGIMWILLIFACVVVHELAHSILAQRRGASVRSITLLPIGGVSQIERMPEGWANELQIAAVGPAASIALSLGFGFAALLAGQSLLPLNIASGPLLPRLAWTNLLLGVFNLLPAFPLDGGRVLRAALERSRDPETATHLAARLGRALAAAMVVGGILWDVWIALIGVFIYFGGTQEEQATTIHLRLTGQPVRRLMRHPVATIDARQPLGSLRAIWPGPMVVTLDGSYYGMADGRDIARGDPGMAVSEVADRSAPSLRPDEDLGRSAIDRLISSGYSALPVVQGSDVVGVLTLEDVIEGSEWTEPPHMTDRAA